MAYPSPSDFTVGADNAAYWQITSANTLCSTSGRAFVNTLQGMLGVTVDGKWGANTSTAVINMARALGAPANVITGAQSEATLRQVGTWSLAAAIYLLHSINAFGSAPSGVAITDIVIPSGTRFPQWNTAAPAAPSGNHEPTCAVMGAAPATPAPPAPPAPSVPSVDVTVPNTDVVLPPGVSTAPVVQTGNSVPTGVIIAVGVTVLVIGALAWTSIPHGKSNKARPGKRIKRRHGR
jgi:hypothetical protein